MRVHFAIEPQTGGVAHDGAEGSDADALRGEAATLPRASAGPGEGTGRHLRDRDEPDRMPAQDGGSVPGGEDLGPGPVHERPVEPVAVPQMASGTRQSMRTRTERAAGMVALEMDDVRNRLVQGVRMPDSSTQMADGAPSATAPE